MLERTRVNSDRPGRWNRYGGLLLLLTLLLAACGGGGATPTPKPVGNPGNPGAALATAFPSSARNLDKVDEVFLRLLVVYQTQGLDAARQFARDQGLMTSKEEVRVTLVLDSADPAVVDGTALAAGRLGGRVTATFGNQVELVVPAQTAIEYGKQTAQGATGQQSFFADLAGFAHVRDIRRTPLVQPMQTATSATPSAGRVQGGKSEGIALVSATAWQQAGITGKGIKLGVIDVGFNRYQQFLTGARYTARSFRSDGAFEDEQTDDENVHGTACTEIVHEMAPDAELYLARIDTAGSFVMAVNWLVSTIGATVITASVGTVGFSPTDGTNAQSQAVDRARAAGVFFSVSAGNDASGEIGSDSGEGHFGATFADDDNDGFHDFSGAKNKDAFVVRVTRERPVRIVLNWNDWQRPRVNYDLYLYDGAGNEVARSTINQTRTGKDPVEYIIQTLKAGTYTLKIRKVNADDPSLPFNIFVRGVQLEKSTPMSSLSIPADARGAVTVAAINVQTEMVESFSSQGPTLDGRKKPDLGAPDRTMSFAYASVGEKNFSGTSAAAPHVGGAAALYRQAFPDATPDAIVRFFAEHAKPPKGPRSGDNITGVGRLDLGAVPSGASTRPAPVRATATPRPGLPLTRTTNGIAFADTFAANTSGLPLQGYVNGEYHVTVPAMTETILPYPQAIDAPRAIYEVRARSVSGDEGAMGVLVGYQDAGSYYLFMVSADGQFIVAAKRNGSMQTFQPFMPNAAIVKGGPNMLRVEINGGQAAFAVNGTVLTTTTLPDPATGQFGLVAMGGASGQAEVAFAAYTVTVSTP